MLNIQKEKSGKYKTEVALPMDTLITTGKYLAIKRLPYQGDLIVTEVSGGLEKTKEAFDQIQIYALDHHRNMAALPFYSLVTNRLVQPDSSKWITKIYCPII